MVGAPSRAPILENGKKDKRVHWIRSDRLLCRGDQTGKALMYDCCHCKKPGQVKTKSYEWLATEDGKADENVKSSTAQ